LEIPFEQVAGAVAALFTGLSSVAAFLYKKLSDHMDAEVSRLTETLDDCNRKHQEASQELTEMSKRHANLEGRIQAMETFNPAGLVTSITKAVADLLDQRTKHNP
jgi:F0F1-type ATP synthase membrane subunit b/b'